MPFEIIRNDITRVRADVIVNTANPEVCVGAGVDQAIYDAAGYKRLLRARAKIGPMQPGQAAATRAYRLHAKHIVHTVGPVWRGGQYGERETVASCYRNSLALAAELGARSIAFPLIATGTYGFPRDEALKIATAEISSFLFHHDMQVLLVVYDREAFVVSGKAFSDIKSFIEEKDVKPPERNRYNRRRPEEDLCEAPQMSAPMPASGSRKKAGRRVEASYDGYAEESASYDMFGGTIEDVLEKKSETFQQMLFRIIDRKGLTDPEVYKKANIDRKLFSKIRSNENYKPSKKTVLALAIALQLNLDETADLLLRAGLALSPSSDFDLIVGYYISHGIWDIYEVNCTLFKLGQQTLGA